MLRRKSVQLVWGWWVWPQAAAAAAGPVIETAALWWRRRWKNWKRNPRWLTWTITPSPPAALKMSTARIGLRRITLLPLGVFLLPGDTLDFDFHDHFLMFFSLHFLLILDSNWMFVCQSLNWGYLRTDRTSFGVLLWMKHHFLFMSHKERSQISDCGLVNLCGKKIWFRFSFISLECCWLICVIYASLCILQLFVHYCLLIWL